MNNIFQLAEACLTSPNLESKLDITCRAKQLLESQSLDFSEAFPPLPIDRVQFPKQLRWVEPKDLKQRKLSTVEGRVALLHAVAHIEFNAIMLHWDGVYRYRNLPVTYYRDWLEVAIEEMTHFCLLRNRLNELGADYGDLPVHNGLWQIAEDTAENILARMALVPRFMEARGLDVTPAMIDRLEQVGDTKSAGILTKILSDEIGHVAKGSRWFQTLCHAEEQNPQSVYFQMIEKYLGGKIRRPINQNLRLQAGFTIEELQRLEAMSSIL
ncbi:MAG: hypothetical protein AXA67_12830 [Methylothermaceae bacteria B42]|nr:MAG: hypothetical protein AXA67_12830 [Methylothermaceae bacteria B42]HHJ38492.1 ferritin-like domain-containing protein [Methylothermaceae bacterium]